MLARAALESLLRDHKLDRTLAVFPATRPVAPVEDRVVPTGHARADQSLDGGWPRGHLSELCGPLSAGRSSLLVSTLAAVTGQGELAALVDAADGFDPVPAAARGVVLERVLWVRGLTLSGGPARAAHPLRDRSLTQAVRAFDLILRAGGFAVAVLDLSGIPARAIARLPFTTWLRLGRGVEGSRTAALVMVDAPVARSAGGVSLELQAAPARWRGQSDISRLFDGPSLAPRLRGFRRT
ncbi:MAG: DNA recombination/repair protein RecA, partial [Acidobacteriota bacterium]|nr:DNA recombination/repair protein RecA [Acidobacteriota bacterium]